MTARTRKSEPAAETAAEPVEGVAVGGQDADPEPEPEKAPEKAPESGTLYLNTTPGPLVYDKAGHMVGGGEWTPPVNLDAIGQAARRRNYLLPPSSLS